MKRLILIFVVAVFGSAAMCAGDNGWRLGVTANKSVMASGQAEVEPSYWSLGGEVSYLFNPVWRLTVTPTLGLQYIKYECATSGFSATLGVDAGLKLGYGFSILTGPAVRYGSKTKDLIYNNSSGLTGYWGFGISKDFLGFYISAKYYQSITKGERHMITSEHLGNGPYDNPDNLCKNYFNFSIGYKF